jgi:transcriptional regulator with XRE-family HTH domain
MEPIKKEALTIARQKVGDYLQMIREEKGYSLYEVAQKSGLQITQLRKIEAGEGFTIDSFLAIIHALDVYFFLRDKDGKHLDFVDMAKKSRNI